MVRRWWCRRAPVNLSSVEPVALEQRKHDIEPAPPPNVISCVKIELECAKTLCAEGDDVLGIVGLGGVGDWREG